MSLKDILTKPLRFGSWEFSWHEPMLYRILLRGDVGWRACYGFAGWASAIGLLLIAFAWNVHQPHPAIAIGLGTVFGLGPVVLFLFGRQNDVSGTVRISNREIQRQTTSVGLAQLIQTVSQWHLGNIKRCLIVKGSDIGKRFHVMIVECSGERELIGIPPRIKLKELAQHLSDQGVNVSSARTIPREFQAGINARGSLLTAASGLLILSIGATVFLQKSQFFKPGVGVLVADRPMSLPEQERGMQQAMPGTPADNSVVTPDGSAPTSIADFDDPEHGRFSGTAPSSIAPVIPPPATPPAVSPPSGTSETETRLIGGAGGIPFRLVSADGHPVIGIGFRMGSWSGKERIGQLEPFFQNEQPPGTRGTQVARSGYALGAIRVSASDFVDAVAPVFMRINSDGSLDPGDSYDGEWIGQPSANESELLSGEGNAVVGIHGRGAAVMDAIGLILKAPRIQP